MPRRTKILATLGPATDDPVVLDQILEAGVDVVRLNFSHGDAQDHIKRAENVRNRAAAHGRQVGVLADLQGPKIRIQRFVDGGVELTEGDAFVLDSALDVNAGTAERVGVTYTTLVNDVKRGDTLLLDDGRLILWVDSVEGTEIRTKVVVGGRLTNSKGINLQGGGLSAAALTDKDRADVVTAAQINADYLAVSFPRSAADIHEARKLLRTAGGHGAIVAKIERAEALTCIDEIIEASDSVMIARGDLGVEIGDAELPGVQKDLIARARSANRTVITATQMMESMIDSAMPTRAEVFDVANAVMDGTDAVMLSAETATGKNPAAVIAAVNRVCLGAETQRSAMRSTHRIDSRFERVDESIAMAAMYIANHTDIKAIAALTESGATALWMSRISSGIPIYALSPHMDTRRLMTLYRGVYPTSFDMKAGEHHGMNREAIDELVRRGAVRKGDLVLITKGDRMGMMGGTNAMTIVRVGEEEEVK